MGWMWAVGEGWLLRPRSVLGSTPQVPQGSPGPHGLSGCVPGLRPSSWTGQVSPRRSWVYCNCCSVPLTMSLPSELKPALSQLGMASAVASINPTGRDSPFLTEWMMLWVLPQKCGLDYSILVPSKLSSWNLCHWPPRWLSTLSFFFSVMAEPWSKASLSPPLSDLVWMLQTMMIK